MSDVSDPKRVKQNRELAAFPRSAGIWRRIEHEEKVETGPPPRDDEGFKDGFSEKRHKNADADTTI